MQADAAQDGWQRAGQEDGPRVAEMDDEVGGFRWLRHTLVCHLADQPRSLIRRHVADERGIGQARSDGGPGCMGREIGNGARQTPGIRVRPIGNSVAGMVQMA